MVQSRNDIAQLALRRIGFVASEQAPAGYEQDQAEDGVTRAHGELAHHGIAFWPVDETPDDIAGPFAQYVAGEIAGIFLGPDKAQPHEAQMGVALRRMTAVAGRRDYSDRAVYFEDF